MDHGIETPQERAAAGKPETGRLRVEAQHSGGKLVIVASDDGRGIDLERIRRKVVDRQMVDASLADRLSDAELLDFMLLPGFSTAGQVTEVSGRGVGLDVVHNMVRAVGGAVRIETQPGRGAAFRLELPITLSVIRAVLVEIAGHPYAFPLSGIDRLIRLKRQELHSLEDRQYFEVDGRNVGVVLASQLLDLRDAAPDDSDLLVVLIGGRSGQYGLAVDAFCGERDLVVRPLDPRLGKIPNVSAAAILDDGSPVLIVDLEDLARCVERLLQSERLRRSDREARAAAPNRRKRILVVDDSITVRETERQLLTHCGYDVEVAVDGMEGWNTVRSGGFDLVVSDMDMPRLGGADLVRMIKADPALKAIPVVIVSYKDREEDRLSGLEAGANYYLTKSSFHDETLIEAVRELIGAPDS